MSVRHLRSLVGAALATLVCGSALALAPSPAHAIAAAPVLELQHADVVPGQTQTVTYSILYSGATVTYTLSGPSTPPNWTEPKTVITDDDKNMYASFSFPVTCAWAPGTYTVHGHATERSESGDEAVWDDEQTFVVNESEGCPTTEVLDDHATPGGSVDAFGYNIPEDTTITWALGDDVLVDHAVPTDGNYDERVIPLPCHLTAGNYVMNVTLTSKDGSVTYKKAHPFTVTGEPNCPAPAPDPDPEETTPADPDEDVTTETETPEEQTPPASEKPATPKDPAQATDPALARTGASAAGFGLLAAALIAAGSLAVTRRIRQQ
ncbi:hypothetical protein H8R18_05235 [Nanchangia anserum]|uniref:Uncharacterized protein n=1 Tax=Nanchangia anserum TaxID=2692125 RepID=A0A8I0GBG0_9ACTO|nr:hypothetical protein [Nanchangia anserum]MBD3688946.1 hypothetical protein [Nanchangia anserum]QOX81207.1 hypothetical protein H8R18_05235 [Nanchangia anserum]